jgi:hypothetical protein
MISIVRMKSQKKSDTIWNYIIAHKDELQSSINGQGRLLYLTKREMKSGNESYEDVYEQLLYLTKHEMHEDVSLFVHMSDPDALADFMVHRLSRIKNLASICIIHMLKSVFFPLSEDTRNMKRFMVSLRVSPNRLTQVYEKVAKLTVPFDLHMAYLAYTFHLFGDCIQLSILAEKDEIFNRFLTEMIRENPGILKADVNRIMRTKPLISYSEWKEYASRFKIVPAWDEELMIGQFQTRQ